MPANRKRHAVDGVDPERWKLLGLQLRARRIELGYPVRKAFARDRGLVTDKGAPNVRMINAMENNERPGTYAPGRLEQYARAYEVTAQSVYALLDGKTDELEPAAAAVVPSPGLPAAPPSDLLREDAARPYAAPLWNRLMTLAARGVTDPDGKHPRDWDPDDWDSWSPSAEQLGLAGLDAETWNGSRGAMSLSDRGWLVGDWHARREARAAGRGATSA